METPDHSVKTILENEIFSSINDSISSHLTEKQITLFRKCFIANYDPALFKNKDEYEKYKIGREGCVFLQRQGLPESYQYSFIHEDFMDYFAFLTPACTNGRRREIITYLHLAPASTPSHFAAASDTSIAVSTPPVTGFFSDRLVTNRKNTQTPQVAAYQRKFGDFTVETFTNPNFLINLFTRVKQQYEAQSKTEMNRYLEDDVREAIRFLFEYQYSTETPLLTDEILSIIANYPVHSTEIAKAIKKLDEQGFPIHPYLELIAPHGRDAVRLVFTFSLLKKLNPALIKMEHLEKIVTLAEYIEPLSRIIMQLDSSLLTLDNFYRLINLAERAEKIADEFNPFPEVDEPPLSQAGFDEIIYRHQQFVNESNTIRNKP